jgi:hypothetical protein
MRKYRSPKFHIVSMTATLLKGNFGMNSDAFSGMYG